MYDCTEHPVIRYRCTVSYIGKNYSGWQSQKDGSSIQEHIESALQHLCQEEVHITGSGRTDAGVNARGQVFHFDTHRDMADRKWIPAINRFLPEDIYVLKVQRVSFTFHARHCVRWKKYTYRIHVGPYDVFSKDTACQCPVPLDFEKMKEASRCFVGTKDFTALNSSSLKEYPDQVRTVFSVDCRQDGDMLSFTFRGKGFLRYMVRMMSAALIEVGKGKLQVEDVQRLLEQKSRNVAHKNAPACGLTLEEVSYFDVLALGSEGMIREYLYTDVLPAGYTLEDLEKPSDYPLQYVMTTRHEQTPLARVCITKEHCLVTCLSPQAKGAVEELLPQLQQWMQIHHYSQSIKVRRFAE